MERQEKQMLEILQFNQGFLHPEKWIKYGIKHHFEKIKAAKLQGCPDCRNKLSNFVGQYVYYSTLISLRECAKCGLIFSDTRIDPQVIKSHFEQAYKTEAYFKHGRRQIFKQISNLVCHYAPQGGKVLDVGGAKGHLLFAVKSRRPDLCCVVNDLSKEACDHAALEFGFQTILGGVNELNKISSRFDVIIMSDVIYYEPELRNLWEILPLLVYENGAVIIRVPNKLALIRSWQFMNSATTIFRDSEIQDKIKFYNPEHLYVFSRRYLMMRLKKIGFEKIISIPSELLNRKRGELLPHLWYFFCKLIWTLSYGKFIISPSLIISFR
jgi:SAM-dependent methyltransferase